MIPPNLEAFRALMERVANVRVSRHDHSVYAQQLACTTEAQRHALFAQQLAGPQYTTTLSREDAAALRALATATPAQLCGIVGTVQVLDAVPHGVRFTVTDGDILVTPRDAT